MINKDLFLLQSASLTLLLVYGAYGVIAVLLCASQYTHLSFALVKVAQIGTQIRLVTKGIYKEPYFKNRNEY